MRAEELADIIFGDEWVSFSDGERKAVERCLTVILSWGKCNFYVPKEYKKPIDTYASYVRDCLMDIIYRSYGVDKEYFMSKERDAFIVGIRVMCVYLMNKYAHLGASRISKVLYSFRGRCDVIYYLDIFDSRYENDKEFKDIYDHTHGLLLERLKEWKVEYGRKTSTH